MREAASLKVHTFSSALQKILTEAPNLLGGFSLDSWMVSVEIKTSSSCVILPEIYAMFQFEPLYNLHLELSILLEPCLMTYLASPTKL